MLGYLPRAFPRQSGVVAVNGFEPWRQRLVIRMSNQVQTDIEAVVHALENVGQLCNRRVRNVGDARLEMHRRHKVGQFDRFQRVDCFLAQLDGIAQLFGDTFRVLHPLTDRLVQRQVTFDHRAKRHLVIAGESYRRQRECQRNCQRCGQAKFGHGAHSRTPLGRFGGPPRRQKISGSTTSS